jgi:allophanate hydrolase subunit 2
MDLLCQYGPGQSIHFVQVTLEQAREAARLKEEALDKLRKGEARAGNA